MLVPKTGEKGWGGGEGRISLVARTLIYDNYWYFLMHDELGDHTPLPHLLLSQSAFIFLIPVVSCISLHLCLGLGL